ncbi:hypothetical protein [Burkholderia sp. Tr-20390]|uniref:hypothetical protein n=1 Tax=Burkholderia sp. Tr-20390 TaxID=2703904 RepID=UPI00197D2C90|nr:hypothetical protein [Burkholderia sp. Tr-20390]MBN3731725.1 hypothetical protein [Burkholderia sp. Tr-20390]
MDQDVVFNRNDYQIDEDLNIIEISQPYAVTIGGDWLDILIAHGRVDLIYEILDIFRILIPDYIKKILLSFRPSREFVSLLDDSWVSGVSVPVNILNIGDRRYDDVLRLIRGVSPIYAVHCLAGGLVPLKPALDYALLHVGAKACIVGATKIEQIRDLVVLSDNYLEAV